MIDIGLIKKYLRIDEDEDDSVLVLYIESAKEYLANAGVLEPISQSNLYNLAVMLFVKKESASDEKEIQMAERSLRGIVLQLKPNNLIGGV